MRKCPGRAEAFSLRACPLLCSGGGGGTSDSLPKLPSCHSPAPLPDITSLVHKQGDLSLSCSREEGKWLRLCFLVFPTKQDCPQGCPLPWQRSKSCSLLSKGSPHWLESHTHVLAGLGAARCKGRSGSSEPNSTLFPMFIALLSPTWSSKRQASTKNYTTRYHQGVPMLNPSQVSIVCMPPGHMLGGPGKQQRGLFHPFRRAPSGDRISWTGYQRPR